MMVSISLFYFISRILGNAVNPYLQSYNADYFHFALIGIAFMPLISLSANSLSNAIHEYQHAGTLEILFLSPTPILPSLTLSTLWGYCWSFAESFFFLGFASLFFSAALSWSNILPALLIVLATILANAGLGLINASFVLVTKRSSPVASFLALVTSLLAGVYFPVQVLPDWMRFFSNLIPATYALSALRRTLLQGTSIDMLGQDLLALLIFTLVLLPLGLVSFYFAVRWAKMDGSLATY